MADRLPRGNNSTSRNRTDEKRRAGNDWTLLVVGTQPNDAARVRHRRPTRRDGQGSLPGKKVKNALDNW